MNKKIIARSSYRFYNKDFYEGLKIIAVLENTSIQDMITRALEKEYGTKIIELKMKGNIN